MKRIPADRRDHSSEVGTLVPVASIGRHDSRTVETRRIIMTLGTRLRNMWVNGPAEPPPRPQLTPEQWHYQQQRRAVASGVARGIFTFLAWSFVAVVVMVTLLGILMGAF